MACPTHSNFHSSYPAHTYFKGRSSLGDASHRFPANLGKIRRFGLSLRRFSALRNKSTHDSEVIAIILTNTAQQLTIPGGSGLVIDEALLACLASDAPKKFIPRTPSDCDQSTTRIPPVFVAFHSDRVRRYSN